MIDNATLPLAHSLARRLSTAGWRGARWYWGLAELLASPPQTPVASTSDGAVVVPDRADWSAWNAYRGLYERAEIALVGTVLRPGDTVVDVGANVGYITSVAAACVGSRGRVLAVEPSPRCLPVLRSVVDALPSGVVIVVEAALGDSDRPGQLVGHDRPGHSGLGTLRLDGDGLRVPVRRLDSLLEEHGVKQIDLLKVDVEGYEAEVFAGARQTLSRARVRNLLVEVSPEFGPVEFAVNLVSQFAGTHCAYAISETGSFRSRPTLIPIDFEDMRRRDKQWNLLLTSQPAALHRLTKGRVAVRGDTTARQANAR